MGAYVSMCETSCCGKAFSSPVTQYKNTVNSYKLKQLQTHKPKNIMKWRQILEEKISVVPETIQHWSLFKGTILEHINSLKDDNNIEWIINVKLINSYCLYHHSHPFPSKHDTFTEEEKEEFETFKIAENHTSFTPNENRFQQTLATTQLEQTSINERYPLRSHLTFESNDSRIKRTRIWMENITRRSGKDELKKILKNQLKAKNHIINQLVKVFHKRFDEIFGKDLLALENKQHSNIEEGLFLQICGLVKHFIKVLRKFLMWLYRELIKQFMKILKEEDLRPEYIMEYLSYGVLFTNRKSILNKLIKGLIKKEYSIEIEKLEEKLSKKKTLPLQEYDSYLKTSSLFLMNNNPYPYENVVIRISELQYQQNPYEKFETILALESEMLKDLEKYHKNQMELKLQLRANFGLDIKAPILLYCIVQSQNFDTIVDRILIDKFVNQDFLSKVQNFTTFAVCLDFLLQDEEFPTKREEKMTLIEIGDIIDQKGEVELSVKS